MMDRNINEEFYGDKPFSYSGKYRLYDNFDKRNYVRRSPSHGLSARPGHGPMGFGDVPVVEGD